VRLKSGGGHAGHNGLRSIHQHISPHYDRVRLGVGHPGHKDRVSGYVLSDFAKADQNWLDDVLRGISDGAAYLAEDEGPKFLNAVALRVNPPRPSTGTKGNSAQKPTEPAPEVAPEDTRSTLQKLADKFR
jgi:PTH1 family peptidyl-tRNA hydrolase